MDIQPFRFSENKGREIYLTLYFTGLILSQLCPKSFRLYLLLPYILLGCSRDGPPYPVELQITVWEQGGATKSRQIMKIGVYREGGLPPYEKPRLLSQLCTDTKGVLDVCLELPQPPEYYTLWIDSMPPGYTTHPEGTPLSHKSKQRLTVLVYPP
jgi:hypothetical protein